MKPRTVAAIILAVLIAWATRYQVVAAGAWNGTTAFVLDRWTGNVYACPAGAAGAPRCALVFPSSNP